MRPNRPTRHNTQEPKEFVEKVVQVNRVSKKTKGGNQIGFSVLVVVGDRKGRVGVALGKAPDVLSSIKKGIRKAQKHLITVPIKDHTIPFQIQTKHGAAKVLLKPAPKGSGIIAGGAVRAVVEAAGITDIVGKILGSDNQANNVYATFKALDEIRRIAKIKNIKTETKKSPAAPKKNVKPTKSTKPKKSAKPKTTTKTTNSNNKTKKTASDSNKST